MKEIIGSNGEVRSSVAGIREGLPYLLIGGAIGTALGLLFAPKAGTELRENIAGATRTGLDTTLEKARLLKEQSADAIQTVKEKAESVYDFASGKLAFGKAAVEDELLSIADQIPVPLVSPEPSSVGRVASESEPAVRSNKSTGRKSSNIL